VWRLDSFDEDTAGGEAEHLGVLGGAWAAYIGGAKRRQWRQLQVHAGRESEGGREQAREGERGNGRRGGLLILQRAAASILARTAASGGHGAARQQLADQRRTTTGKMGWAAAGPRRKRKGGWRNWAAGPIRF
jgi:hypothetical protein